MENRTKKLTKRALEEKSIEKKVKKTIKRYNLIKEGDTIVIGVSGGPDSMTLLNLLEQMQEEYKISIIVAHVNHGIREEADLETKYVQEYCKKNNIKCYVKKEKVEEIAKRQKIGTEEAGRNLRYAYFEEIAQKEKAGKIAVAHNANDNAETVLMNLMRGSTLSGLKGIEPKRGEKIIRPLIECTREEIEEYCERKKIEPKYDKTNKDNKYTRNKIRNELIPYIKKEFNPNIIQTLKRLSENCKKENDYIQNVVEKTYKEICLKEETKIVLDLEKFNKLEETIKSRIIIQAIQEMLGNSQGIEKVNIEDIIKMCEKQVGNKYIKPRKGIKVAIKNKKIFFEKEEDV